MNKLFKKIGNIVLMGLLAVSLTGGMLYSIERKSTAEAAFYPVQTKSVRLYSGISSISTSARLRSFYDLSGSTKLTMAMFGSVGYVTFDPGTPKEESASFTGITDNGDGTQTLTGLTRGLLGRYPFGTGGVAYSHDANSYVVASNGADFYSKFAFKENNESVTGVWNFNTVLPVSSLIATTSTQFVTKALLDGTIAAGVATSSESNFGGVWLGTALQQASSTNGGANQPFVMQTRYATDTPTSGCAVGYTGTAGAGCSVIATLTGKIKQTFLDIFSTVNTWTGTNTFTATTNFSATTTGALSALYGDGSDGIVTITSGTTTLTRDMYYDSLTVNNGATVTPSSFRIFVKNTLTVSGAISGNGMSGSAGTDVASCVYGGGCPASASVAGVGGTSTGGYLGFAPNGGKGGNGGSVTCHSADGTNGSSGSIPTLYSFTLNSGGTGGNGGAGAQVGGCAYSPATGGASSSPTTVLFKVNNFLSALHPFSSSSPIVSAGASGGGAGGSGSSCNGCSGPAVTVGGAGGGAGANGSPVQIFARTVTITSTGIVSSNGGNGGKGGNGGSVSGGTNNLGAGGGGGGAGGSGGWVQIVTSSYTNTGTLSANAGVGGTYGTGGTGSTGSGANGTAGANGSAGVTAVIIQ